MPRRRSAAEILGSVPPRDRAKLRALGVDLDNPVQVRLFVDGVRVADEQIAEDARREASANSSRGIQAQGS